MIKSKFLTAFLLINSTLFFTNVCQAKEIIIPVKHSNEITVEQFPATGKYLMIWLAPEYGIREAHRSLASMLAKQNIEVWQSNILESLFLPQSSSSLKILNGNYVADIIEYAHKTTNKKIIVAGDSYSSLNALLGAHRWQQRKRKQRYLVGAVLFTPNTYSTIPPLGQLPEYMPIISATNIPIMIYQAGRSGNSGQFNYLVSKLQQHGNPVYSRITPAAVSLFYGNKFSKKLEQQNLSLSINIKKMITILEKHIVPMSPIPFKRIKNKKNGIDIYLKKYQGDIKPLPINLKNVFGKTIVKNNYKGKITLINFWATWCPPCVKEIPSLNRLKNKMSGMPFELISINYAQDKETILSFMKKVNVEFPVLLDTNGNFAKKWNVITYPSTFIIDKEGNIKYGVNAAIEWDSPEFIEKIKSLL